MTSARLLLLHGVATTGRVWNDVVDELRLSLDGVEIESPDRPATGDLAAELAWLAPRAEGAILVGFSGGATLGLALASSDVRLRAALLHEPAVGSLVPGLLAPVAAAYERDGYRGFGEALYGNGWSSDMVDDGGESVARELPMFRAFEPAAASAGQGRVVVSVGALSPAPRHAAAEALHEQLGFELLEVPASNHFAVVDNPSVFAAHIRALVLSV